MSGSTWDGAILCGGRSSRMGRDKALLAVDGEPMVLRVARALLRAGARRIAAVGGDRGIRHALAGLAASSTSRRQSGPAGGAVLVVPDETPGEGPLGGVLTALNVLDAPIVLVVACDLLEPSAETMAATVAALATSPSAHVAAPVTEEAQVEWLHAAWRRSLAHPALAEQFAAGERAIHRAVAHGGLALATVAGLDPESLTDADSPADLPSQEG